MLYGKWRPRGFAEVVGQDHIVTTLRNALATGQVAHGYLFSGPRGTGKTTTARILARAVNCSNLKDGEPCNDCPSCIAIGKGAALDLIEMDAASNRGIDDIRQLREKIGFAPSDLKMKVYLLDEVHMLTQGAFNALLKTLEEPPPHAIFILATTEAHEVPATIVSRCQRYDFHRIANDALVGLLADISRKEGYQVPEQGLLQISIQSRGGARDAITMLEQVVARYGPQPSTDEVLDALGLVHDERSERLAEALVDGDLAAALDIAQAVGADGINVGRFAKETLDILRGLLPQLLRGAVNPESGNRALAERALGAKLGPGPIAAAIQELSKADFRLDPASPVPLEVACAAALLGPMTMTPAAPAGAPAQGGRPAQAPRQSPAIGRSAAAATGGAAPGELNPNQKFMNSLYDLARTTDNKVAAKLHECEVLELNEDTIRLGVYYEFHLKSLENEGRPILERAAEQVAGRPLRIKLELVERPARDQRARPKTGHLAEAAKAMGAVPVGREE